VEASAAALLSLNGADVAPAARVELVARPGRSRWGLSVAATIEGTHRADVAPGEARWWRWGGEVAVSRGLGPWRGARIDARAGVALTAVELEGHGFSENGGARLLDPGAAAAVRLVPFAWRARPWVEVSGAVWPRGHELSVTGAGSTAQLPRGELLLGIGAAFGAPP
jgi:hypothetical protein